MKCKDSRKIQDIIKDIYLEVSKIDLSKQELKVKVDDNGFFTQDASEVIWPMAL